MKFQAQDHGLTEVTVSQEFLQLVKLEEPRGMLQLLVLSTPKTLAIVDQTLNSTIHWINHYPADK